MSLNRVGVIMARGFTNSASRSQQVGTARANPKIKQLQEHFCKEDGTPVHLKGGVMDHVLYRVTMGLCVLAIGLDCKFYYDCAMKK